MALDPQELNQQRRMANRASWLPGLAVVIALSLIADFGFKRAFVPPFRAPNATTTSSACFISSGLSRKRLTSWTRGSDAPRSLKIFTTQSSKLTPLSHSLHGEHFGMRLTNAPGRDAIQSDANQVMLSLKMLRYAQNTNFTLVVKLEIRKSRCAGLAHSPTSHKRCEVGF